MIESARCRSVPTGARSTNGAPAEASPPAPRASIVFPVPPGPVSVREPHLVAADERRRRRQLPLAPARRKPARAPVPARRLGRAFSRARIGSWSRIQRSRPRRCGDSWSQAGRAPRARPARYRVGRVCPCRPQRYRARISSPQSRSRCRCYPAEQRLDLAPRGRRPALPPGPGGSMVSRVARTSFVEPRRLPRAREQRARDVSGAQARARA